MFHDFCIICSRLVRAALSPTLWCAWTTAWLYPHDVSSPSRLDETRVLVALLGSFLPPRLDSLSDRLHHCSPPSPYGGCLAARGKSPSAVRHSQDRSVQDSHTERSMSFPSRFSAVVEREPNVVAVDETIRYHHLMSDFGKPNLLR